MKTLFLIFLIVSTPAFAQTTFYKCHNEGGVTEYSERPCSKDASPQYIENLTHTADPRPRKVEKTTKPTKALKKNTGDLCTDTANMAEDIMTARQNGADILDMYAIAANNKASEKLARALITAAFSASRFNTEKYKAQSITEFKTEAMLACLRIQQE